MKKVKTVAQDAVTAQLSEEVIEARLTTAAATAAASPSTSIAAASAPAAPAAVLLIRL
jgi:hypothetical protein